MPRPERLRGATIVGTGCALPERILSNFDLEKMVETSDEWIVTRTGIKERRMVADGQDNSDIAAEAALKALAMAGLDVQDVDHIFVGTVTPDRILPSMACTVQEKIGASHAACLDINAACSGFLYGLQIAQSLIQSGSSDTVLLIGAETLTRILDFQDRNTCVLFGDGAGAAVLRPCDAGTGVLSVKLGADGAQGDMLTVPAGGSERPATHETVSARDHFIKMRGNELFKYAVRAMEQISRDALAEAGRGVDELVALLPHQANQRIIDATADRLGIPKEKVMMNIERYGNTSAASVPILLDEVVRTGRGQGQGADRACRLRRRCHLGRGRGRVEPEGRVADPGPRGAELDRRGQDRGDGVKLAFLFPGQGSQAVRHGPEDRRGVPGRARRVRRGGRRARLRAERSHVVRSRGDAQAHGERAARAARALGRRLAGRHRARPQAGVRRGTLAWRVQRARRRRFARLCRRAPARAAPGRAHGAGG
jgi:3-oxoacyl-[acyl-carrier-protein] synthase-3